VREEGDARRAVRMQQVRGAVACQVERRRIGARGCDPVGVLARLRAPLEVGTGEEVGSIVIHERALAAQAVAADSTPGNCASWQAPGAHWSRQRNFPVQQRDCIGLAQ
jgi:hypothetical protein